MTATYDEATDAMYSQLYNLWVQATPALVGYVPSIYWPMVEEPRVKAPNVSWARMSRQTVIQSQSNLAGADHERRYTTKGLLAVQVFTPMLLAASGTLCINLAKLVQRAYRGATTDNGIWFRNCTLKELPADGTFYRCNVTSEFQYDEVG